MGYYCNICHQTITDAEYRYSVRNFERPLCRKHQSQQRTSSSNTENAGDFVVKSTGAFTTVYEKGGVGLLFVVAAIIILLFFFLFKASLDLTTTIVLILISVVLLVVGGIILYKKEQSTQKR